MRFSSLTPLILILAFSCSSEQPHDHASHEGKGLNDAFLADNLKVEEWVERFEKEGREIFSQRAEIAATANLTAGMVMADIGAGTGLTSGTEMESRGRECVRGFSAAMSESSPW